MNDEELEKLNLVFPHLIGEINRYRDWPIRILTFTSAFNFGLIGFLFWDRTTKLQLGCWFRYLLLFFVVGLFVYTFWYVRHCHKNYLESRNVQIRIQNFLSLCNMKIGHKDVFPPKWFKVLPEDWHTNAMGSWFYVFYAFSMAVVTCLAIWKS